MPPKLQRDLARKRIRERFPSFSCLRRSWWHPFIIIPSGAYTLVQTAGRDVDYSKNGSGSAVWPSGFHWASPFFFRQTRISHVVSKQSFVFISDYSNVRTKDDVSVDLRMSATVRIMGDSDLGEDPQLVRNFVHKLGPVELTRQLQDALEEHVRFLARCVSHSDVYKLCALSKQDKLGLKETNIVLQTEGTRRTGISEVTVAPQGGDGSSGTVSSGGGSGNVLQGLDHSSQKMENELFGALLSLPLSVGNYEEATLEDEKVSGDDSQNNDSTDLGPHGSNGVRRSISKHFRRRPATRPPSPLSLPRVGEAHSSPWARVWRSISMTVKLTCEASGTASMSSMRRSC